MNHSALSELSNMIIYFLLGKVTLASLYNNTENKSHQIKWSEQGGERTRTHRLFRTTYIEGPRRERDERLET